MKTVLSFSALLTAILGVIAAVLALFEPGADKSKPNLAHAPQAGISQSGVGNLAIQGNTGSIEIGR